MRRGLACLLTGCIGCAPAAQATASLADCARIADDATRLACYDGLAAREAAAPVAAGPDASVPSSTRAATAPEDTELDRQWQLRPHLRRGPFQLLPYRSVYALAHATTAINNSPSSPTRAVGLQDVQLQELEAKVQLSFKSKLVENAFGGATDLWFGYTQQSYWQAANTRYSSPFRETDYEPELIALHPVDAALAGLRMRYAALSVTHESNGRGEVLSRSWNRLIGDIAAETGAWTFHLRPWLRLDPASGARDDNPDIQDFVGRGELIIAYRNEGQVVTLRARHSLRAGARSHGSARLDWAFPLTGSLHGHVQLFRGYGESLIDYNHPQSTLGIGVSFFD